MPIRIATVCGSVRPKSQTSRALALVIDELRGRPKVEVSAIDLDSIDLPLPGRPAADPAPVDRFRRTIENSTGVVFATPEYHGSFSSVIKLAIENLGFPSVLAGKPVSLLGVASGQIGAIKSLEHLRSVCSHVGAIVLPALVSVARVHEVFDEQGRCLDPAVEKRIRSVATVLVDYIEHAVCPRLILESMVRSEGR